MVKCAGKLTDAETLLAVSQMGESQVRGTANQSKRRIVAWLLKAAISGSLLLLVLRWVPLEGVANNLNRADVSWVLVAYALAVPIVVLSVQQLHVLLKVAGVPISFSQLLWIHLTTEFWGLLMPGYLSSGALRFYRMSRAGSPAMRTLAVVVFRRLFDAAAVVLMGWVFWSLGPVPGRGERLVTLGFAGVSLMLLAVHMLVFNKRTSAWLRRRLNGTGRLDEKGRIRKKLLELPEATAMLAGISSRSLWLLGANVVARNTASVATFFAFAASLSVPLSFASAGFAWAVVRLAVMLPVSVAGVGLREVSLLLVMPSSGIPAEATVALSFLLLSRDLLIKFAGGCLEAWTWVFRRGPVTPRESG